MCQAMVMFVDAGTDVVGFQPFESFRWPLLLFGAEPLICQRIQDVVLLCDVSNFRVRSIRMASALAPFSTLRMIWCSCLSVAVGDTVWFL